MISNISKTPIVDILSSILGVQIVINESGGYQSISDGSPVSTADVDTAIAKQHQYYIENIVIIINEWTVKKIVSGFTSAALGSPHAYQSEIEDQLNLSGLASSGGDWPFKCSADGGTTWAYIPHTNAQLQSVVNDGIIHKLSSLQQGEALKAQVRATTNQAEVDAINWPTELLG